MPFQAKSLAEPFAFEEYRKKRIQDKIEEERVNRVKLKVCRWTDFDFFHGILSPFSDNYSLNTFRGEKRKSIILINTKHLSIQSYTHPRKVFCLTVREIYSADEKKKKEREKIKREERGKKKEKRNCS